MFQRREQIRTQTPFVFAHSVQIPTLQKQRKKALSKIFRLLWLSALPPHETINGSPIRAAKFFQRSLRCRRWTLRLQNNTPMSCRKRRRAVFCAWGDPITRGVILIHRHVPNPNRKSAQKQACAVSDGAVLAIIQRGLQVSFSVYASLPNQAELKNYFLNLRPLRARARLGHGLLSAPLISSDLAAGPGGCRPRLQLVQIFNHFLHPADHERKSIVI